MAGSVSPMDDHAARVLALVSEQPDLILDQTAVQLRKLRIRTTRSSFWRFLDLHNITFKKARLWVTEEHRGDWPRARRR
jgi:hypothetical protein